MKLQRFHLSAWVEDAEKICLRNSFTKKKWVYARYLPATAGTQVKKEELLTSHVCSTLYIGATNTLRMPRITDQVGPLYLTRPWLLVGSSTFCQDVFFFSLWSVCFVAFNCEVPNLLESSRDLWRLFCFAWHFDPQAAPNCVIKSWGCGAGTPRSQKLCSIGHGESNRFVCSKSAPITDKERDFIHVLCRLLEGLRWFFLCINTPKDLISNRLRDGESELDTFPHCRHCRGTMWLPCRGAREAAF